MTTIDHAVELHKAGANVDGKLGVVLFYCAAIRSHDWRGDLRRLLVAAIFSGWIAPHDPLATNADRSLAAPDGTSIMGRRCHGAGRLQPHRPWRAHLACRRRRLDLLGGILGVINRSDVRLPAGLVRSGDPAHHRHHAGTAPVVMALVMAAALGPSLENTIIAISIPLIPHVARVIRSNTLSLREMPFVESARAVGMSEMRIAVKHILPNTLAPFIVLATAQLGSAILTEASLSFLGLGIRSRILLGADAVGILRRICAHRSVAGDLSRIAISLAVFGTNLLGDAFGTFSTRASAASSALRRPGRQRKHRDG